MSSLTAPRRGVPPLASSVRAHPWAVGAVLGCLGLALLSLLTPSAPTTDPWGWIVWGREVAHLDLDTSQGGSPSWKPLPVLLTTPLSLTGDALPEAWLVVARTGGLLGLVLAVVLTLRLLDEERGWAAMVAAAVAGLALVASPGWLRSVLHGYSEPLVLALVFGGVLTHLSGRRTLPLALLMLTGLGRPELWAVIGLYGLWVWRSGALSFRRTLLILLPIPLLWFGGDFWGSGDPLHGSGEAASIVELRPASLGDKLGDVFGGAKLVVPALALLGVALRPHDRVLRFLVAACAAFVGYLCLLDLAGYPVSARFFEPPLGMACVLAGVSVGAALHARRATAVVAAAAGVVMLAVFLVPSVPGTVSGAHDRAELQGSLRDTVATVGRERMYRCGDPIITSDLHWNEGAMAWEMGTHLGDVRRVLPWKAIDGEVNRPVVMLAPVSNPPFPRPWRARAEPIGRHGEWGFYRLSPATADPPPPCAIASSNGVRSK